MKKLVLIFIFLSSSLLFASGYPEMLSGDPRKVRKIDSSPKWLEAVARLIYKNKDGKKESCSLTLLADHPSKDGQIAITAGHCVDHWASGAGGFKVKKNNVTFKSHSGRIVQRKISKVIKAETHKGDYAIVKLNKPIKKSLIKPLMKAPWVYKEMISKEKLESETRPYATVAGYSSDSGKGQKGKVLTYDQDCKLNGGSSGNIKSYCHAYPGASGGVVAVTANLKNAQDEEWQDQERTYFVGNLYGVRKGDSFNKVMFTNLSYYRNALDKVLAEH